MCLEALLGLPIGGYSTDASIVPEHVKSRFLGCESRGGSFDSGEIVKVKVKVSQLAGSFGIDSGCDGFNGFSAFSCDRLAM